MADINRHTMELTFLEAQVSMPLMRLPVRSAVVSLPSARILISPASTLTVEQLRSVGEVTDIVAPSLWHTGGVPHAAQAHPRAKLWGAPGASQKHPQLSWNVLGTTPWPYEDQLPCFALEGAPNLNEFVLFHRHSGTLLVMDLIFNLQKAKGLGAWIVLHAFGTYRRFGVSRLLLKLIKDKAAFQSSLSRIVALDFKTVVPSHGEIVEGNGKALFVEALRERGLLVAS